MKYWAKKGTVAMPKDTKTNLYSLQLEFIQSGRPENFSTRQGFSEEETARFGSFHTRNQIHQKL